MIEDALKSARNAQRLLLLASLVALFFLGSLSQVSAARRALDDLHDMRYIVSDAYGRATAAQAEQFFYALHLDRPARALQTDLFRALRARQIAVAGVEAIPDAFARPAHLGRARPEAATSDDAALMEIITDLSRMPRERDAEILVADPSSLAEQIILFLERHTEPPLRTDASRPTAKQPRIEHVRLAPRQASNSIDHSFLDPARRVLPDPELITLPAPVSAVFRFELRGVDPGTLPKVFEMELPAGIRRVPSSSFGRWITRHTRDPFHIAGGALRLPKLIGRNHDQSIAALQAELRRRIQERDAPNRSIELVGLSIPGSLALIFIPLTLLGLTFYLLVHLDHLCRLAAEHRPIFRQFSWLAVAPGPLGLWEVIIFVLLLPLAVHLLLIQRSGVFDPPHAAVFAGAAGAAGTVICGGAVLKSLLRLRKRLHLRTGAPFAGRFD